MYSLSDGILLRARIPLDQDRAGGLGIELCQPDRILKSRQLLLNVLKCAMGHIPSQILLVKAVLLLYFKAL